MIQIINLIFVGIATSILLNYSKYKNRKKLFITLTILFYIFIIPLISRFIYILGPGIFLLIASVIDAQRKGRKVF
jgi:hypothetical protein